MNPFIKNILVVLAGLAAGSLLNMGIIMLSGQVIPPPDGVDPTNMESLVENMHLFEAKHFIMPFLAHAIGALVGGFVAAKLALKDHKLTVALVVGGIFLVGGIMSAFTLPAPTWFKALDILLAYIPMAYIGYRFGK